MINEQQKQWVINAIEKGFTKLQIKKKLQDSNYDNGKILEIFEYYDEVIAKYTLPEVRDIKEEKKFEESVKKYVSGKEKELSWSERRAVKSFLKNVTKYNEVLKTTIKAIKLEIETIHKKFNDPKVIAEEEEMLKQDIIDRIMDSKEIIDIENPITKEDATKENLKVVPLDMLIEILEDNVDTLDLVVNGKIG